MGVHWLMHRSYWKMFIEVIFLTMNNENNNKIF